MNSDALFQLGVGPAVLEASQTEDRSSVQPERDRIRMRVERMDERTILHGSTSRLVGRLRGNSTKALGVPA